MTDGDVLRSSTILQHSGENVADTDGSLIFSLTY